MSELGEPYIPASESPLELTRRVIVVGILLGILMTAANAYLGLYAGMTVSASIPAAVMSMIILRSLFKNVTILENNAVQTMASAGESLAAGIIFTVPALLVIPNVWDEIKLVETTIIALLGGLLGTMFTIALRRLFIVEEALPYPEGVACREVLVAGEEGGEGAQAILYALGIGAIYGLVVKGFQATHHTVESAFSFLGTRLYAGMDLSIALLSVGFIVGIRIASFIFLGGVIGFGILVPMYGLINGWGASGNDVEKFYTIWAEQIRYVGVGAMVVGGLYTLWSMRKTIITGILKAIKSKTSDDSELLRTEIDLPMNKVFIFSGILVLITILFYWAKTGSLILAIAGGLFLALTAFFFAAVAGYIAGVVGSSNSPVSGMTIATLLFTVVLVLLIGDGLLNLDTSTLMLATMLIASIVASSAAIAGDVMQDLKTGHMVGATPRVQQIAEIIGVITGALVIGPTLKLLHSAFGITQTACLREAEVNGRDCSNALLAPQAELIGDIVRGAFIGDVNVQMILLGVVIAIVLIWLKMPVMSVAIGIYLPLGLSVPIMLGGIISYFTLRSAHIRIDGELRDEPSKRAKEAAKEVENRGVLIGAGFIAGESILGVFVALLIVTDIHLNEIFSTGTLNNFLSLVFFGWFVAVFIWLATRALPSGGNSLKESIMVVKDSVSKFIRIFIPNSK
ncbi:MAG: oligopeptide transporter, OPT family [Candidatus Poseidoniaceae archaeon]|jgi:putative OPT family oligopeptide transporter|nr:oligopeptide transporter, OPT family [Candidatus Poseidoniaceae archaeon]